MILPAEFWCLLHPPGNNIKGLWQQSHNRAARLPNQFWILLCVPCQMWHWPLTQDTRTTFPTLIGENFFFFCLFYLWAFSTQIAKMCVAKPSTKDCRLVETVSLSLLKEPHTNSKTVLFVHGIFSKTGKSGLSRSLHIYVATSEQQLMTPKTLLKDGFNIIWNKNW